jgi:hypothetical protein
MADLPTAVTDEWDSDPCMMDGKRINLDPGLRLETDLSVNGGSLEVVLLVNLHVGAEHVPHHNHVCLHILYS